MRFAYTRVSIYAKSIYYIYVVAGIHVLLPVVDAIRVFSRGYSHISSHLITGRLTLLEN